MSGTTANRSYPYPQLTDTVDVPGDIQALADALDTDVQDILDNYLKGESASITTDSTSWTTAETQLISVTLDVVSGITYGVSALVAIGTSLANDIDFPRIREDSLTGNQLVGQNLIMPTIAGSGYPISLYTEYTAVSTASKTFVLTGNRIVGTGAHQAHAATNRPSFLTVTPLLR